MKKYTVIALVCCICLIMAGCGKSKENPKAKENVKTEDTTTTDSVETQVETTEAEAETTLTQQSSQNLIPGGTFDETSEIWGIYMESGGDGSFTVNANKQLEATILSTGTVKHAYQIYCDGFELLQNAVYQMSFDISSDIDRIMDYRIQINGGDYHAYTSEEGISLTKDMQHYTYTFTMEESSDPAPRLCFNLGFQDTDGQLTKHTVLIDNVELLLLDDSKVVSSSQEDTTKSINLNQVGYKPSDTKTAIFRDSSLDTDFNVVNIDTGETVYSGKIIGAIVTPSADETVGYGDFSKVTQPGTYKITALNSGESYSFTIAEDVYHDIFKDTVKMLYLQRCGTELPSDFAGDFAHPACHHNQKAYIYGTKDRKDVSGGWHDAGDYGRYVVSGAKAVADLMLTYELYEDARVDDIGIPESGNSVPDILDEARYELDWLLKMQDEKSGGVYHKVTNQNFEDTIMPNDIDASDLIAPISNCATGDFAAVMAMAARVYQDYDKSFSKTCLKAAKKALNYMESHDNKGGFVNPKDVLTGEYPDTNDRDEYLWACAELFKTTGNKDYNKKINTIDCSSLSYGLGWQAVDLYAYYAYLTADNQDTTIAKRFEERLNNYIDTTTKTIDKDGYFSSIEDAYPWGSNMTIANNGMILLLAQHINTDKTEFTSMAQKQLDYLLGANPTSYCFVTGYGSLSPQSVHHRPSQVKGIAMKGMLVGGANSNLEDPYAQNVLANMPAAKCYVDNVQSYSCNEVTVYWNSPLIFLLAGLSNESK